MSKPFAKQFYSSEDWISCRDAYVSNRIRIDGGMCEACGKNPGEEVHHETFLTPQNINNPNITLNHSLLKYLCRDCHMQKHRAAFKRHIQKADFANNLSDGGLWYDDNGQPHTTEVYIVWGPPGSGKSKYISEHYERGDMIIDLDQIKNAIAPAGKAQPIGGLLKIALDVRELLFKRVEDGLVDARRVWIATLLPKRDERLALAKRLHAQLIFIQATRDECMQHIKDDVERLDGGRQEYIIDRWFEDHQP